jgi:hypothetical protein
VRRDAEEGECGELPRQNESDKMRDAVRDNQESHDGFKRTADASLLAPLIAARTKAFNQVTCVTNAKAAGNPAPVGKISRRLTRFGHEAA